MSEKTGNIFLMLITKLKNTILHMTSVKVKYLIKKRLEFVFIFLLFIKGSWESINNIPYTILSINLILTLFTEVVHRRYSLSFINKKKLYIWVSFQIIFLFLPTKIGKWEIYYFNLIYQLTCRKWQLWDNFYIYSCHSNACREYGNQDFTLATMCGSMLSVKVDMNILRSDLLIITTMAYFVRILILAFRVKSICRFYYLI